MNGGLKLLILLPAVALVPSCVTMKHQLEQSKPLEINVNVRLIDDRLEEFYAFERKYQNSTTQPATQPVS